MPTNPQVASVTISCAELEPMVKFYSAFAGLEVAYQDESAAFLAGEGTAIGLQVVEGLAAPDWPTSGTPHAHIDFAVPDVDAAATEAIGHGASKADHQPGGDMWTVMIDPGGNPFCLTQLQQ